MSYYPNNPNGQATMANSAPVVIASDQSAIPVSGSISVASTTANQGTPASTANRWPVQITDGTDLALVTAGGDLNVVFSNTGIAVTQTTSPWVISGAVTNTVLSVVGAGTEATAQRVTIANDSTGVITVKQGTAANLNATVVGTGTFATQAAQSGTWNIGTVTTLTNITNEGQLVDNAAFTDGTTRLNMAGYIFDEVAGTALTENDGAAARVDSKRAVVGVIEDATTRGQRAAVGSSGALASNLLQIAGVNTPTGTGVSSGSLRVTVSNDGTGRIATVDTVTNVVAIGTSVTPGTSSGHLGKAEDAAHASGDTGVMALAVRRASATDLSAGATDGDYEPLQVDATGRLWVNDGMPAATLIADNEALPTTTRVGSVMMGRDVNGTANNIDVATLTKAYDLNTDGTTNIEYVLGVNLRTGASGGGVEIGIGGNPLVSGGNIAHDGADAGNPHKIGGKARQTNPTAVADADRVDAMFDDVGRLVTKPYHVRDLFARNYVQVTTLATETTILAAGAAGVFHDLTSLVLTNGGVVATSVTIKDSTAGTTRFVIDLGALGSNNSAIINFTSPFQQSGAAANWTATISVSTAVNITVQAVKEV